MDEHRVVQRDAQALHREVVHGVDPAHQLSHRVQVGHVGVLDGDASVPLLSFEVLFASGREVVDDEDFMAGVGETIHDVAPDEARASGDGDSGQTH